MDDDNIFPAEVAPEVLFDEIINGSQAEAVQLSDGEETKEEETVIPSSKDALTAIKLIQLYPLVKQQLNYMFRINLNKRTLIFIGYYSVMKKE